MSISSSAAHRPGFSDFLNVATPGRVAAVLAALTALFMVLWPLGVTSDYFNHLARNHIEANIWFDVDLQRYYGLSFSVIPDLTMDLIVPWLSLVTGTYAAGAFTVWIALIVPPLAGMLIARNIHGHVTWCSLAGFLVIFNANMQWGFINFVASTGIALLGFAVWMNLSPRWTRAALFAPFSVFLALNHALGFLLFGYLVLLWEVACFVRGQRQGGWAFGIQLLTRDALSMLPGILVLAFATSNSEQLTHVGVTDFSLIQKLNAIWSGAEFFNPLLGRVVTIIAIVTVFIGLRRRILHIEPRMALVCAGMLLLILAMPTSVLGIWGLHFRYPAILFILVAASVRVDLPLSSRHVSLVAVGAVALMTVVFANAAAHLASYDRQTRALKSALAELPQGVRVLPARTPEADLSFALHSAALAVIERSAYVPNLFTNTSPVDVHPQMLALHMPQAWPLKEEQLLRSQNLELPPPANGHWSQDYYFGWPDHWDYVLFFRTNNNQYLNIATLCIAGERTEFVLYRISDRPCENANVFSDLQLRRSGSP
ncbi:MAG: hypothetical protein ACR2O2_16085 [Ruegeria sp.]